MSAIHAYHTCTRASIQMHTYKHTYTYMRSHTFEHASCVRIFLSVHVVALCLQANNIMPILICTVIAYSVAGLFTISLYDMMLEINGLPYLPRVMAADVYRLRAQDTMHTKFPFLSLRSTGADALALISSKRASAEDASSIAQFPLVDSPENMTLLGAVARDDLEEFVLKDPRLRKMFHIVRSAPHWMHDPEATVGKTPAKTPRQPGSSLDLPAGNSWGSDASGAYGSDAEVVLPPRAVQAADPHGADPNGAGGVLSWCASGPWSPQRCVRGWVVGGGCPWCGRP